MFQTTVLLFELLVVNKRCFWSICCEWKCGD